MSTWGDMRKRAEGKAIRKEDIHKATLLIKKVGNAERLSGFYTGTGILFKLNQEQRQSFRWHNCELVLDDERFKRRAIYRLGVLTTLGDTGKTIIQDAIDKVEREYGYFDGYTCNEEKIDIHKYVSEKNEKMLDEIRGILDRHGMMLLGWRHFIRYRRAVSAELVQDLYYDDTPDGKEGRVLRPYGTIKEKEIGLYNVAYECYKKKNGEEIVTTTSTDYRFYAPIGSDVVSAWQKVNDEHVRLNGNWNIFVGPKEVPNNPEHIVLKLENDDIQENKFSKIKKDYFDALFKEYGCKLGQYEDNKLIVRYWDAFTNYLKQKNMDILKNVGSDFIDDYKFSVGIDDFYYNCSIDACYKNPACHIKVILVIDAPDDEKNLVWFDFFEKKLKAQIESLQCKEVKWNREKLFSRIGIILDADFRDKSDWQRQFEWLYNTLMGLHQIVKPYYGDIRRIV